MYGSCSQEVAQSAVNHALWSGGNKFESPFPYHWVDMSKKKKKRMEVEKFPYKNKG